MRDFGDVEYILKLIDDTFDSYRHRRQQMERLWFRNILFLVGNQWIKWDETDRKWRNRRLGKWVPTPVTNRFASTAERLVAVLSRVEPNWTFIPASDREEDILAASVADALEDLICEENRIDQMREEIASWLVYTGNAFIFSWAEQTPGMMPGPIPEIPSIMNEQGVDIGGQMTEFLGAPANDYKLYSDILSPFEVWGDPTIPMIHNQKKILLVTRKDRDWIRDTYGVDVPETEDKTLGLQYLESIGTLTEGSGTGRDLSVGGDDRIPRVTLKRLLVAPCENWPQGLFAVKVGDRIVESLPWPAAPGGEPVHPLSHMKFGPVPGAFYGRTPMNDIVRKQEQRNKLEAMIELITIRMASPIWLLPQGTSVAGFSGEPGAVLKYTMVGDKASKPDRIPGEQIPSTVIEMLRQMDSDMEELAATFEAIKGKSPYSGAPGVVIDQLIEQGMTRFGPALRSIGEGYRQWMKTQIELFRLYATTPRMIATLGENAKWKFSKFSSADITGAVNVRVESDSTIPRSESVKAQKVMAAVNAGLIDIQDPMIRLKVLKTQGLSDLMKQLDEDVLSAVREHEAMMRMEPIQAKPFIDNHAVHIQKHRAFANSEEGAPFISEIMVHLAQHNMLADAEMNPGGMMAEPGGPRKQIPGPDPAQAETVPA